MKALVTGGAGYIGSHTVRRLMREGHEPVVYDNLSEGHRGAIGDCPLVQGDIADRQRLTSTLSEARVDAVIHFAAHCSVGESVKDPAKYYRNNVVNGLVLLDAMIEAGVQRLVFSSSAAVYGIPSQTPIDEDHPKNPVNPYGRTKLHFEESLAEYAAAYGLAAVSLRYFNAAGASPQADIGEDHCPETHLIPLVLQTALGQRDHIDIYGTDYDTPDGTCVRDYIHVDDLADAHIRAMDSARPGQAIAFNMGNGQGYSVREVIEKARQITGKQIPSRQAPRRAGDPPLLVASASKIMHELGWRPQFPALDQIIATAWEWHQTHPRGYDDRAS